MSEILVAHCIDAEGPLGGDARRLPDGSPEFFDNWADIHASLAELTDPAQRGRYADSSGRPYRFTWFTFDFTGFKTNPKQRDTTPHAVYDLLKSLDTAIDEFGWHHHCPPVSGIGDEWADRWDPSEADKQLERLKEERGHTPRVFRAGGTIEDNDLSRWLEERFPLDFSNRVSERSTGTSDLSRFDWCGAPLRWGPYQPSLDDFKKPGTMSRRIYRCIDLRSRYNQLTADHVDAAFLESVTYQRPAVLSFFSHDNRDMRDETRHAVSLIRDACKRHKGTWRSCTASEADLLHVRGY